MLKLNLTCDLKKKHRINDSRVFYFYYIVCSGIYVLYPEIKRLLLKRFNGIALSNLLPTNILLKLELTKKYAKIVY